MSIEINNETDFQIDVLEVVKVARCALDFMQVHPQAELSIMLVDLDVMEKLHVQWMDEPGATDVLSFPMDELLPGVDGGLSDFGILGDIVLCPEFAESQAAKVGNTLLEELLLLTTHGVLHLLGYDHVQVEDKKEMFSLQFDILAKFFGDKRVPKIFGELE